MIFQRLKGMVLLGLRLREVLVHKHDQQPTWSLIKFIKYLTKCIQSTYLCFL